MKIILAPQALKGSLDAAAVGAAMADGVRIALPDAEIAIIPVADGGEGTVRALVAATGGQLLHTRVTGPLGELVEAEWGFSELILRARREDRRDRDGRRLWSPTPPGTTRYPRRGTRRCRAAPVRLGASSLKASTFHHEMAFLSGTLNVANVNGFPVGDAGLGARTWCG